MSDWVDEQVTYEENNWEDLAEEFIRLHDDEWNDFVAGKFFNQLGEQLACESEYYKDLANDR